jgi:3-dehydroquinate dehydratase-2
MAKSNEPPRIVVLHGPNLNLLGRRNPAVYGSRTLQEINADLKALGQELGVTIATFQSNHEGRLVDWIQEAAESAAGLIINPAAYTHTSVAIRDALEVLSVPIIEVHLSNIFKREDFRRRSLMADIVSARITGFGPRGYLLALRGLVAMLSDKASPEVIHL